MSARVAADRCCGAEEVLVGVDRGRGAGGVRGEWTAVLGVGGTWVGARAPSTCGTEVSTAGGALEPGAVASWRLPAVPTVYDAALAVDWHSRDSRQPFRPWYTAAWSIAPHGAFTSKFSTRVHTCAMC